MKIGKDWTKVCEGLYLDPKRPEIMIVDQSRRAFNQGISVEVYEMLQKKQDDLTFEYVAREDV